jgi:hypothetical protein
MVPCIKDGPVHHFSMPEHLHGCLFPENKEQGRKDGFARLRRFLCVCAEKAKRARETVPLLADVLRLYFGFLSLSVRSGKGANPKSLGIQS